METLGTFLRRFREIKAPDETVRRRFVEIISSEYDFLINIKGVKVVAGVLYYNAPPALKQSITLEKREILNDLNKCGANIKDII